MLNVLPPRIIILADGESTPQNLSDRYFTRIDGEELLFRTARQFGEWAHVDVLSTRTDVIGKLINTGIPILMASDYTTFASIDMIRKGLEHCGPTRTIILFGDVVFTDEAVQVIREGNGASWGVYGRSQGNLYTGTPWAEWFAFEINDDPAYLKAAQALTAVAEHYRTGRWESAKTWDWYYEMEGMPYYIDDVANVPTGPHWVEINDATDDIDFAGDIVNLRRAHEKI